MSHSHGGRNAISGLYRRRRPRPSRSPVQQALISSEAKKSIGKAANLLVCGFFCACEKCRRSNIKCYSNNPPTYDAAVGRREPVGAVCDRPRANAVRPYHLVPTSDRTRRVDVCLRQSPSRFCGQPQNSRNVLDRPYFLRDDVGIVPYNLPSTLDRICRGDS